MDFEWSVDDRALIARIREFGTRLSRAKGEVAPAVREQWRRCADFGLAGLSVPTELGGLGLGALSTAAAVEAWASAYADTGFVFSVCAHLFACAMPIVEHGAAAQRERWCPGLANGALIGANAITEPEAGSDVFAMHAIAERKQGQYWLNGVKSYVTNSPIADIFLVYASTDRDAGFEGITAFVVEANTPGLRVGAPFAKTGLTTASIAPVYLEDCRVPESQRLGDEGQGRRIFAASMAWERSCLFAAYLGVMETTLDKAIEFARTRRQFNRPIGRQQAIAHRIADMKLRMESARWLVYRACWLRDRGEAAALDVALAKLATSEAAVQSGLDAIRIHGGLGVMSETGIDQWLRDALPATIFSGTSEIQREIVARELGL